MLSANHDPTMRGASIPTVRRAPTVRTLARPSGSADGAIALAATPWKTTRSAAAPWPHAAMRAPAPRPAHRQYGCFVRLPSDPEFPDPLRLGGAPAAQSRGPKTSRPDP